MKSVVVRDAIVKIYAPEANVSAAVAIIADGNEIAIVGSGDGRNTVRHFGSLIGLEQWLLHGERADALGGRDSGLRLLRHDCRGSCHANDECKESFHSKMVVMCEISKGKIFRRQVLQCPAVISSDDFWAVEVLRGQWHP